MKFSYPSKVIILFCLTLSIVFLRSRHAYLYPVVACEDGNEMLAYYFNNRSPAAILRSYADYVALLPNLVGYGAARLPLTQAPLVLTYYPLLVAALAHTLFALRRFRIILPDDRARMLICLLLAVLPIGDVLLFSNTTYSIWNLLWIALLLIYAPLGSASWQNGLQLLLLALLVTSHPLSFLLIPICLYNLFTRRGWANWLVNGSLLLIIEVYLVTAIRTSQVQFDQPLTKLVEAFWLVVNRVIAEALLGYGTRMSLHLAGERIWLDGLGLAILLLLSLVYLRAARRLSIQRHVQLALVGYWIVAIPVVTVFARAASPYSLWGPWELRYFFIPQKLFWLLLAVSAAIYLQSLRQATVRSASIITISGYLFLLFLYNLGQFQTLPSTGRRLATFLQTVERGIDAGQAEHQPVEFVLTRSCFDIRIWVP